MNHQRFPDQFLPPAPGADLEAWAWARQEAHRLPPVVLAALDPFTLRDRIACYERTYQQYPERGAMANVLLLRAVLDRAVTWQADRLPTRPTPERGPDHGRGGAER
jgi:hypothetical protein